MVYMNEAEVGSAIREKIAEGVVKREDLFIVSKVNSSKSHRDKGIIFYSAVEHVPQPGLCHTVLQEDFKQLWFRLY